MSLTPTEKAVIIAALRKDIADDQAQAALVEGAQLYVERGTAFREELIDKVYAL